MVKLEVKQAQNIADITWPAKANLQRYKLFSTRYILHVNYQ